MSSRTANALPRDSSLGGSTGVHVVAADDTRASSYVLIALVHKSSIKKDISFWNATLAQMKSNSVAAGIPSVRLWGVCDEGAACSTYQAEAHFVIIGFLDPYEMKAVYLASKRHDALICNLHSSASTVVTLKSDPIKQASELDRQLKEFRQ